EFKRNIRAGGMTKYHNSSNSTHRFIPQIDIITRQNQSLFFMGMEKIFQATPIHGLDSLFIQLYFPLLKITVRPFVSEISSLECKRILFHLITDIDATTGLTANQRAVLKSGKNFL
ncbi:hypothetical protein PV326_000296, partial [Microctonus aethiopoides]